jgi:biofilm PGA synthesis N-glycosyltransferase PgaC
MLRIALAALGLLAAVWVVYPLAVAALAALRRARSVPSGEEASLVSVVLATRGPAEAIERRIADLVASAYDPSRMEIVVSLDAAADLSAPALGVSTIGRVRVTVVPGDAPGGKAATVNAGVRAARGDVLVFADTHQRFHRDAIPRLERTLRTPRVGAVSGSLELPAGRGGRSLIHWYWRYERWLRHCEATVHSSVGVTGAIYAMRRSAWSPLPPGLILDDLYAPMRAVFAGYRVLFAEDARASDTRPAAPAQEFNRKVRTLTGVIQLCAWMPGVLVPWRNPVWVQFLFHKVLRLLTPYLVLIAAVTAGALALDWLAANARAALALGVGLAALGVVARRTVAALLRQALVWGVVMQAAVVVATVNGCRGRWDVWRP